MSSRRTQGRVGAPPTPKSVTDLNLTRERKKAPVDEFLERGHPLGSVPGWKACFGARYRDHLVAVVVVGRPVSFPAPQNLTRFGQYIQWAGRFLA